MPLRRIQLILPQLRPLGDRFLRSAVIWIWAVTLLRLGNFFIVLPIALRSLPSESLGLWYLMLNVVSMVSLAEFGLSAAIARQATFFFAGAGVEKPESGAIGREPNWSAIHGLIRLAVRLYSWLGWLAAICCLAAAAWLAWRHPAEMLKAVPLLAAAVLSVSAVLRMRGLFWNTLLFGLQQVRESQRIQFTGILISYGVSLAGLLMGGKMLALAAGQMTLLLYPVYRSQWLLRTRVSEIFTAPAVIPPWRPVWSSTWRAGAVFLGTWLGTQVLIFACGQTAGLSVSASFSLSSLVAFTIHSTAQSWILARYPTITRLWAIGDRAAIAALALRRIAMSMGTFVMGAAVAWLVLPYLLSWLGSKTPPLPPTDLAILFCFAGLDLFVSLHSSVLSSCNLFPHMRVIVGVGIASAIAAFVAGSHYGVRGILIAPLLCQLLTSAWIVPLQCWRILTATGTSGNLFAPEPISSAAVP